MRKIDKQTCLSKNYEKWVSTLGEEHPKYTSSAGDYYKDIVMSLFYCQRGLCAYTERRLCNPEKFSETLWVENEQGDMHYGSERPEYFGQLDHFNPDLKPSKGWSWDNFFMIDSDVNRGVKKRKVPDPIVKPDGAAYDPNLLFQLLPDYRFEAHPDLESSVREAVSTSINDLGINYGPVVDARRRSTEAWLKALQFGIVEEEEYPTARQMIGKRDKLLLKLMEMFP